MNKALHNKQTSRGNHESYEAHEPVKGKNWVKLNDGTIAPMPRIHPVGREASDELALSEAVIGLK